MNTKISDDGRGSIGMTGGKTSASKSSSGYKVSEEENCDSGIISSADLSQSVWEEIGSEFSTAKYDRRSNLKVQSSSSSLLSESYNLSERLDSKEEQMGMSGLRITDSGVCTDVSECLDFSAPIKESNVDVTKASTRTVSSSSSSSSSSIENIFRRIFSQDEDGDTHLHLAIINNDLRSVYEIMKIMPSVDCVNIRNYYSQTCLHLSVLMNLPKITRLLLLAGAKTDIEDRNGNTALHLACINNNLASVKALLTPFTANEEKYFVFRYKPVINRSIAELNEYNYDGLSCLHIAAAHEDRQILKQLLKYGADVNITECKGGYTLLHEAVQSGDVNLVAYILQYPGIDIDRKNYARRTAYQLASRHPSIRQLLLENGSQHFSSDDEDDDDEDDSFSGEDDDEELDSACSVYTAA